ncbi:MAG: hypothetical protein ACI8QC_001762 [Planctomycetota bacterium]|jgi:hypothetical protein
MTTYSTMIAGLALMAGFGAPVQDTVELRFAPAEGQVVKKQWVQEHKLNLETLSSQIGTDAPVTVPMQGVLQSKQVLSTTDDYVRSMDNRPARLRRSFDQISIEGVMTLKADGTEFERKATLTSKLQGFGVQYSWVPEDQEYGKFYYAKESREEYLANLGEGFDMRCVLPEGPVAVGSSWQVDPAGLSSLVAPCGDVRLRAGERMDQGLARGMRNGMGGGLEMAFGGRTARAAFTVTLKEIREGGVAVLSLSFRGSFLNEDREFMTEDVLPREAVRGAVFDRSQITLDLEGRGEVLWSLEQGRALSMTLACAQTTSLKIVESTLEGQDAIQTLVMRGSLTTTFSSEEVVAK